MFEQMTYENILTEMLNSVENDVDKREGSIIYDALAPCAYQLAQTYFVLNHYIDLVSGDTAVGEYLDRVVADYGIIRKPSTHAVRKITTTGAVNIGTRWGMNGIVYAITEVISENVYKATCEQIGDIGNTYSGDLENIDNISGIQATLTDIITSGEDEESDENLRARFFTYVQKPSTSGNADNYKQWALEVIGVGDAKIFPLWNGPGTVKVVIVDSSKLPASLELVEATKEYIESVRPIGANISVTSGIARDVNVAVTIVLANGYNLQSVTTAFTEAITEYFKSIAFSLPYISHAKLGTILLGIDGVLDYNGLKLNGVTTNIPLEDEEIPIIGTVGLVV